ncbi:MAG: patatin family protein [Clostridia bacterium]|nr:patatin family protein [Clostridia bacterium]
MKSGIVFEGGASRSLFSCGVMDALLEEKIIADYVIGTSAGIAYGTSYVSGQIGRNLELAVKYMHDKRYMGIKHLFNRKNRSYYNRDFAFGQIPKELVPYDFDAFDNFKGTAIATLTNMKSCTAEYFEIPKNNPERHIQILWAGCALPFMFSPEEIDGEIYMDGGICDPIPFQKALDDGCEKLVVVLTRERDYKKEGSEAASAAKIFYRRFPLLPKALKKRAVIYNESRRKIFELADKKELIVIAPQCTKGFRRTEKNPEILRALHNEGYNTTKQMIDNIKQYLSE